ncbi:MAG: hypothetical protein KGH61_01165 [Candidatus Micrarchaeota archaeon]|nr:hypothetical protein [Candidatus Micrarchaeota archaeon]MDE1847542.1 hypothetical protein [Candidatus Micrarchaeota archaeon]MDE1864259.1 hypothetical protein [Candidatus Micrarchaeota archaeon]
MKKSQTLLALAGTALLIIGSFMVVSNIGLYVSSCKTFSCPVRLTPLFGLLPMSYANLAVLLIGIILLIIAFVLSRKGGMQ